MRINKIISICWRRGRRSRMTHKMVTKNLARRSFIPRDQHMWRNKEAQGHFQLSLRTWRHSIPLIMIRWTTTCRNFPKSRDSMRKWTAKAWYLNNTAPLLVSRNKMRIKQLKNLLRNKNTNLNSFNSTRRCRKINQVVCCHSRTIIILKKIMRMM
jgi:hypothetical protein